MRSTFVLAAGMFLMGANLCAALDDVLLQPDESASKDVFVYQFLPTTNFDAGGFQDILGTAKTNTGHDMNTLIQFDLSGVVLQGGDVAEASLYLYTIDGNAIFWGTYANPRIHATDPAHNLIVDADLYAVDFTDPDWDEALVTWGSKPEKVLDSETSQPIVWSTGQIDGILKWIRFDVTDLVKEWLSYNVVSGEGLDNYGMLIAQRDQLIDMDLESPTVGLKVGVAWSSAAGTNLPYLEILAVQGCLCGDIDPNGVVDLNDFLLFAGCFEADPGSSSECTCSDMNGDNAVDLNDFLLYAGLFDSAPQGSPPNCGA